MAIGFDNHDIYLDINISYDGLMSVKTIQDVEGTGLICNKIGNGIVYWESDAQMKKWFDERYNKNNYVVELI